MMRLSRLSDVDVDVERQQSWTLVGFIRGSGWVTKFFVLGGSEWVGSSVKIF